MENYIVINGKKAQLTKEQLESLGIKVERYLFKRMPGEFYFCIDIEGDVFCDKDFGYSIDNKRYDAANYCHDENLMNQRALHEMLDRLLWRFACENGELENPWDGEHEHWYLGCNMMEKKFFTSRISIDKGNELYFPSEEIANRAINEIVFPFMKKHPDFVW